MSTYKCSCCEYTSKTKWNVQNHISKVCKDGDLIENIVKVSCDICGKSFNTERLLSQHKEKCFEKKTVVVKEFLDPEKIEGTIRGMMTLITSMQSDIEKTKNENEELKRTNKEMLKRLEELEKLKSKNKEEEKDIKEANKDNGELCGFFKEIKIIPVSREQVKGVLKEAKCQDDIVDATIEGQRSIIVEADISGQEYIEVGTQKYYYRKKGKNDLCASKLKIIFKKYCGVAAHGEIDGCYYCSEHLEQI